MENERILYPCYFDSTLTREEGRRVPLKKGTKHATLIELEKALLRCKIPYRTEKKAHPAFWYKFDGRAIVQWKEQKQKLIRIVSDHLEHR